MDGMNASALYGHPRPFRSTLYDFRRPVCVPATISEVWGDERACYGVETG